MPANRWDSTIVGHGAGSLERAAERVRRHASCSTLVAIMTKDAITADVRVSVRGPAERVFDYFVDLRNEPEYNQQVREIIKTSPGPIGPNTTFQGTHRGFGRVTWRLAEYERPKHVVIEGAVGNGVYRWTSEFEPAGERTTLIGHMQWQPSPRWRRFKPVLDFVLRWNARRSFRRFADVFDSRPSVDVNAHFMQ